MTDLRQTPEYTRYMEMLGWSVARYRFSGVPPEVRLAKGGSCQIFIRKLPLLGNIGKLQRPEGKLDPEKLNKFAREHKLAAFYIEPSFNTQFTIHNTQFTRAKACFLPSKTIQIDLVQPEEELFSQIKKDARYAVRFAKKQGVVVRESKDIEIFIKFWQRSARSRGMWLPQKKEIAALWNSFGEKRHILFAYPQTVQYTDILNNKVLAGVLLARSPDTAYYMYAFSTKEGNKLSAPTLLAWEAIKLAKRQGSKVFDFEGIYDERYPQTKNWKGFTKFKEGFGGKTVTYPKTLVRYYHPAARIFL